MRDDLFRAPSSTPYAEHMTPDEKEAFSERQGDVGAQIEHSFKVFGDAVTRIATAVVEERLKGEKVSGEKAAYDLGHSAGVREARGESPANLGGGAVPAASRTDNEILDDPKTPVSKLIEIRARQNRSA